MRTSLTLRGTTYNTMGVAQRIFPVLQQGDPGNQTCGFPSDLVLTDPLQLTGKG